MGLVLGVLVDAVFLRTLLGGRDAFLRIWSGRLVPLAIVYALVLVLALAHLITLVRAPGRPRAGDVDARDARRLLLGSGGVAFVYLAAHAFLGPLGVVLRGGDAFVLLDSIRRSFPTVPMAVLHATGLVALGLHPVELVLRDVRPSRRLRGVAVAMLLALVHGAFVLDPIARETIGRALFVRSDAGAGILPSSSPTGTGTP